MTRTGRPAAVIELSESEREQLLRWSRRAKSSQVLAQRSKIVLACAEGMSNKDIAVRVGVSTSMVTKWRTRFAAHRAGRVGRRTTAGTAARDQRRTGGGGDRGDLGGASGACHAVVAGVDGRKDRVEPHDDRADLA